MYCCYTFENLINNAGKRGLSVLVRMLDGEMFFCLQMRPIDFVDRQGPVEVKGSMGSEYLTLSESMGIRYCPSCGKCLADLASANLKSYKKLIPQHEPFQDDWGV